jgi:hypothetical protein
MIAITALGLLCSTNAAISQTFQLANSSNTFKSSGIIAEQYKFLVENLRLNDINHFIS